jgi:hypothetical protein
MALRKTRLRWDDNIKKNLKEIRWKNVNLIYVALVNMVKNL